jgi:hypothetical protein
MDWTVRREADLQFTLDLVTYDLTSCTVEAEAFADHTDPVGEPVALTVTKTQFTVTLTLPSSALSATIAKKWRYDAVVIDGASVRRSLVYGEIEVLG